MYMYMHVYMYMYCTCLCESELVFDIVCCSHQLLRKLTEAEGGGNKVGGASVGGGKGGGVDTSFRETVTLFRLTTDAVVKVRTVYLYLYMYKIYKYMYKYII